MIFQFTRSRDKEFLNLPQIKSIPHIFQLNFYKHEASCLL